MFETISAVIFTCRPYSFKNKKREDLALPDGETAVVWWPPPQRNIETHVGGFNGASGGKTEGKKRLWVCLPGGMTHGDTFYLHGAEEAGLFEVFKPPWIILNHLELS